MVKSPSELRDVLRRQWENASKREARLLGTPGEWPFCLSIGRPTARMLQNNLDGVKRHIEQWRAIQIGEVITESIRYRQASDPIAIPTSWKLSKPTEWIEAIDNKEIQNEFETLGRIIAGVDQTFHSILVRKRALWIKRPVEEVILAAELAKTLEPACCQGRALRTISYAGIDTKFFERHGSLITSLLDVRFEGEASKLGLETFLNAWYEDDHWLLILDLDGSLLPFKKMRIRSSELRERSLPGRRLIVVENEACQHNLPNIPDTVAVLGAGFDLTWADANWLRERQVGYWGDLDTWGLSFLAKARSFVPHLVPLMMAESDFETFCGSAVHEPVIASTEPPASLTAEESKLYRRLRESDLGRLEQEFLPVAYVHDCIRKWSAGLI